jgi:hypothetical protein
MPDADGVAQGLLLKLPEQLLPLNNHNSCCHCCSCDQCTVLLHLTVSSSKHH